MDRCCAVEMVAFYELQKLIHPELARCLVLAAERFRSTSPCTCSGEARDCGFG